MEAAICPDSVAPPLEAYSYWPSGEAVCYGEQKKLVRLIFYKVAFTEYEEEQYRLFEQFMQESFPAFGYPEWMGKEERIRVLLGCKFSFKKSAEAIFSAIEWRNTFASRSYISLFDPCQSVLNTGAIYIHGRDHRYRPLLVLNIARLDLVCHTVAEYQALICFLLEFMTKKMMLPGQVENWVVITDLAKRSLFDLPITELKQLIKLLQDNFRCRMTVNYIVNAPKALTLLWGVVKVVIEEHTLKKLRILKPGHIEEMRTHFALHQYEEKYGGIAPNAESFWPPTLPPAPFHCPYESPDAHLSHQSSYSEYCPPNPLIATPTPLLTTEVSRSQSLHAEFNKMTQIKQDTDEVPDPDHDLLSVKEYFSPEQAARPKGRRRCCPRDKCLLS
jgi:hypothetical protein